MLRLLFSFCWCVLQLIGKKVVVQHCARTMQSEKYLCDFSQDVAKNFLLGLGKPRMFVEIAQCGVDIIEIKH